MLQVYLRSLSNEPALIYTEATLTTAASLELAGPTQARQTLKTLLQLIFPYLRACSHDLKTICTQDPLFQYWFQVEAIIDAELIADPLTPASLPDGSASPKAVNGDQLLWRGLRQMASPDQALTLQQAVEHLSSSDWILAERLFIAGIVSVANLQTAIQQLRRMPARSLADWLLQHRLVQSETLNYLAAASRPCRKSGQSYPQTLSHRVTARSRHSR
ncbi:hypothetical protein [Synechococcus elongatus]|uniref:Uncharacterized protein n=1 Tax=Synechococcus elongatus PCC 11801 TaxID=2219813 RepID=A0AAN1QLX2_SYNEL|nr:hypothetical protein [Synechococcus elongatus]AZB71772.1 hypothetical protein DOP62_02680 [Synechococcus elongatus PCC 11801]